jgi:hypothetical protein
MQKFANFHAISFRENFSFTRIFHEISFRKNVGEFEAIFETALAHESGP